MAPPKKGIELTYEFSRRQIEALNILDRIAPGITEELLYGGGKGGGKSVLGCRWMFMKAKDIMNEFKMKRHKDIKNIPVIGFMGRKQGSDFSATTMLRWKQDVPPGSYQMRMLDGRVPVVVIENTVAIMYGGMDNQHTIKKFNSAELMFYFLDQAEELSEQEIAMVRGSLRLQLKDPKTKKQRPPAGGYKGLLTANPARCWLKEAFVEDRTRQKNCYFLKALAKDNPFLPAGYVEDLRRAFKFNPALLTAYLDGLWDNLDDILAVIPQRYIDWCVDNPMPMTRAEVRKITVCDIAEMGSDETVIYDLENATIAEEEIYAHRDPMETVGRILGHAKKHGSNMICVDKVGVGSAVYSRLQQIYSGDPKMEIYGFDSRICPPEGLDKETYVNYKTYAWMTAANEVFAERKACLPRDPELARQLAGVTYHFQNGKMMIDKKEDLVEVLKVSPGRADALIMGLDAIRRATPITKIDRWVDAKPTADYPFTAATV